MKKIEELPDVDELISPEGLRELCMFSEEGRQFLQECQTNPDTDVVIRQDGKADIKLRGVHVRERLHRKGK